MRNISISNLSARRVAAILTAVALSTLIAWADNTTLNDSRALKVGQVVTGQLSSAIGPRPNLFYTATLHPNRSYAITAWIPEHERSMNPTTAVGINDFVVTNPSGATIPVDLLEMEDAVEFAFNHDFASVRPTVAGPHTIRVSGSTGTSQTVRTINLLVQETTLFSPWFSTAAGFEGFIELHNNTTSIVNVTLRAYGAAGVLMGNVISFNIPANATIFKTAGGDLGVVGAPGGVVLTHNGPLGAVSGNITTLSGAIGLSFDSAFAPRHTVVISPF